MRTFVSYIIPPCLMNVLVNLVNCVMCNHKCISQNTVPMQCYRSSYENWFTYPWYNKHCYALMISDDGLGIPLIT